MINTFEQDDMRQTLILLCREVLALPNCHNATGHRIRHDNAESLARIGLKRFGFPEDRQETEKEVTTR